MHDKRNTRGSRLKIEAKEGTRKFFTVEDGSLFPFELDNDDFFASPVLDMVDKTMRWAVVANDVSPNRNVLIFDDLEAVYDHMVSVMAPNEVA